MFDSIAFKPIEAMISQQSKTACCVNQLRRVGYLGALVGDGPAFFHFSITA
jgi:hypothetical protein